MGKTEKACMEMGFVREGFVSIHFLAYTVWGIT